VEDVLQSQQNALDRELQQWQVFLKRRKMIHNYMQHIPQDRVNLDVFIDGSSTDAVEYKDQVKAHYKAIGLSVLNCGTVGCLAGWLLTMPDIANEFPNAKPAGILGLRELEAYIGFRINEVYAHATFCMPFSSRTESEFRGRYKELNDWQIAIDRCQKLVRYAEKKIAQLEAEHYATV